MDLNLLEKRELWIENIKLENVNLNQIAEAVAGIINVPREKVLVVDVRDNHITLDILTGIIEADLIIGREKELIGEISKIKGVKTFENTSIHSAGILGLISIDKNNRKSIITESKKMAGQIEEKIRKRAIVFPTGFELKKNMIEDTNTPYIIHELEKNGFKARKGDVIDDDIDLIAGNLRKAVIEGYGLVITTGGVGAEDKDKTVEAIEKLDNDTASPYIVKFKKGTGRHMKDGVRIGVGKVGQTLIIALPGPNDEVRIGLETILEALKNNLSKEEIAHRLAEALRKKLMAKFEETRNFHHAH